MFLSTFVLLALSGLASAVVGPGTVTGDTAVHDPTMCKDNSGKYWVFCMFFLRERETRRLIVLTQQLVLGSRYEPRRIGRLGPK